MNLINRDDALAVAMHSKDPVEGIKNLPAVDAVEVVRCKYCKHWDGYHYCDCHSADENGTPIFMREYDFCSYGKPRDGE